MKIIAFTFIYTFSLLLVLPPLFPYFQPQFFAPFLILAYYRKEKKTCLWLSLLCGLLIDLLSAQTRFGVYALNYSIVTTILYGQRRHFFEDSISTVPLLTFLFSFSSSLLQPFLIYIFDKNVSFSFGWAQHALFWFPLSTAFYALIFFTIPYQLLPRKIKRKLAA